MACPMDKAFECWCCDEIDDGNERLKDSECFGGHLDSGITGNTQRHCTGTPTGTYGVDNFGLGGACRVAVYSTGMTQEQ